MHFDKLEVEGLNLILENNCGTTYCMYGLTVEKALSVFSLPNNPT